MIKIITEVNGKKYRLVKERNVCKGCAFLKDDECQLPQRQRVFNGANVCGKLHGIWEEVKNDK